MNTDAKLHFWVFPSSTLSGLCLPGGCNTEFTAACTHCTPFSQCFSHLYYDSNHTKMQQYAQSAYCTCTANFIMLLIHRTCIWRFWQYYLKNIYIVTASLINTFFQLYSSCSTLVNNLCVSKSPRAYACMLNFCVAEYLRVELRTPSGCECAVSPVSRARP